MPDDATPKCIKCPKPAEPGRTRCGACLEKVRAHYAARKAAGRCVQAGCGKPPQPGRVRCKGCHAANRALAAAAQRKARTGKTYAERPY